MSDNLEAQYQKQRDAVATWDEILDILIWAKYDFSGPEHQPVTSTHLENCCSRWPHFAERIRDFCTDWNKQEPITDEQLEAAGYEVSDEEVSRGTRAALRVLKYADNVRRLEGDILDLAMLVKRLVAQLHTNGHYTRLADQAMEYLTRKNLHGSIIRDIDLK